MIATAEAFNNEGFISPGPNTTFVYLNHASGSQQRMLILALSECRSEPESMKVEMDWLTPTHLQLAYKGQCTVDFQAVRYAGIDISLRELSPNSRTTGTSQSRQ